MNIPAQLLAAFPKRPLDLHKYSAGTVTVVGGSSHYIHAPVIAGLGARAAGALRPEGKEYEMRDGDVVEFMFNRMRGCSASGRERTSKSPA